jgi:hypothetical protein
LQAADKRGVKPISKGKQEVANLLEKLRKRLLLILYGSWPRPPGAEVFCGAFLQKSDRLLWRPDGGDDEHYVYAIAL